MLAGPDDGRSQELIEQGPDTCLQLDIAIKEYDFKQKEKYYRATLEHCHVANYMTYIILSYKQARQLKKLAKTQSTDTLQGTGEARRQIRQAIDLLNQSEKLSDRKQQTHPKEEKLRDFKVELEQLDHEIQATFSLHNVEALIEEAKQAGQPETEQTDPLYFEAVDAATEAIQSAESA